jgi:hypothetical protein
VDILVVQAAQVVQVVLEVLEAGEERVDKVEKADKVERADKAALVVLADGEDLEARVDKAVQEDGEAPAALVAVAVEETEDLGNLGDPAALAAVEERVVLARARAQDTLVHTETRPLRSAFRYLLFCLLWQSFSSQRIIEQN